LQTGFEYTLNTSFTTKAERPFLPAGFELAREQLYIGYKRPRERTNAVRLPELAVEYLEDRIIVFGNGFQVEFNKDSGFLDRYLQGKHLLIEKAVRPNFWRAPNDNDFGYRMDQRLGIWRKAADNLVLRKFEVQHANLSIVRVFCDFEIPDAKSYLKMTYVVYGNGEVVMEMHFVPGIKGLPDLPRFGMQLELPDRMDLIEYYGRGPHENYCDRNTAAFIGLYKSTVFEQYYPYIRPQENGYKTDNRWLVVMDDEGRGLFFKASERFGFSSLHYTTADFDQLTKENYKHTPDVEIRQATFINIDKKQMGVGGDNSWGARPHVDYRLPAKEYKFSLSIRPFVKGFDPFELWQQTY
jgi:beta-galactosidase